MSGSLVFGKSCSKIQGGKKKEEKKNHQSDFIRAPIKVCAPQLGILLLGKTCLLSTSPQRHLLQNPQNQHVFTLKDDLAQVLLPSLTPIGLLVLVSPCCQVSSLGQVVQ